MRKKALISILALFTGLMVGMAASTISDQVNNNEDKNQKKFCQEVEQGIQEEMDEGFVNCFKPTGAYFGLREDIRDSTSISCICRKKINGLVQQIKIAQPDQ